MHYLIDKRRNTSLDTKIVNYSNITAAPKFIFPKYIHKKNLMYINGLFPIFVKFSQVFISPWFWQSSQVEQ